MNKIGKGDIEEEGTRKEDICDGEEGVFSNRKVKGK